VGARGVVACHVGFQLSPLVQPPDAGEGPVQAVFGDQRPDRVPVPPLLAEGAAGVEVRLALDRGVVGRTVWASFDWVRPLELKTALEQQRQLSELVDARRLVVKTAAIEEAIEEWSASQLRRVRSMHSALILASEEELLLAHARPMPPS
jgi:hypothetical protein